MPRSGAASMRLYMNHANTPSAANKTTTAPMIATSNTRPLDDDGVDVACGGFGLGLEGLGVGLGGGAGGDSGGGGDSVTNTVEDSVTLSS